MQELRKKKELNISCSILLRMHGKQEGIEGVWEASLLLNEDLFNSGESKMDKDMIGKKGNCRKDFRFCLSCKFLHFSFSYLFLSYTLLESWSVSLWSHFLISPFFSFSSSSAFFLTLFAELTPSARDSNSICKTFPLDRKERKKGHGGGR